MKTLKIVLSACIAVGLLISNNARAGNETRGTNAEVLVGMSVRRKFDAAAEARFQERVNQIRQYILSGHLKERVRAFIEQADENSFLPQSNPSLPASSRTLVELRRRGVWGAIDQLQIDLAETRPNRICEEQPGVARAASTHTLPGAPICADPELVGLFELGIKKMDLQQSTVNDFLFGIIMHEVARWYDLDQDHSFLFTAAEEVTHQTLVEHRICPANSNLCLYKESVQGTNRREKTRRIVWDRTQSSKMTIEVLYKQYAPIVDCAASTSVSLAYIGKAPNVQRSQEGRVTVKDPLTAQVEFNLSDLIPEQISIPEQHAQVQFINANRKSSAARVYNSATFNTSGGFIHHVCQVAEVRVLNQDMKVVAQVERDMNILGIIEIRGWRRPQTYVSAENGYNQVAPIVNAFGFSSDKRESWAKAKIEDELAAGVRCETLTFQKLETCSYLEGDPRLPETLRYACKASVQKGVLAQYEVKLVNGQAEVNMNALSGGFAEPVDLYPYVATGFYNTIEMHQSYADIRSKVWSDILPKFLATAGRTSIWKDIPWNEARYSWSNEGAEFVGKDSKLQFLTTNTFEFENDYGIGNSNEPYLYLGKSKKLEKVFLGYDGGGKETAKYFATVASGTALLPLAPIAIWKPFGPFKAKPNTLQFSRCKTLNP